MVEIQGWRAMLCFPQMATKAQITPEQYLHTSFEYDAEYVRGEIVERSMPDNVHSLLQYLILMQIGRLAQSYPLFPRPELRLRLAADVYRIPDVTVFAGVAPKQPVPSEPPLLVIEIVSKDDRHHDVMEKLEEYRVWGVPNIWLVDPIAKRLSVYTELGLHNVSSLALPEYGFELTPTALFSDL